MHALVTHLNVRRYCAKNVINRWPVKIYSVPNFYFFCTEA